jgi:hypothetical protein
MRRTCECWPPGMASDLLRIYLQDHRAGATAGRELAARAHGSSKGTEFEQPLARLLSEIEEDMRTLDEVMARLEIGHDRLKKVAFWTGEKVGRLKLNGRLLSYSPLSRVVELEGLMLGITAKGGMWVVLEDVAVAEPRLAGIDFAGLVGRAERQRSEVDALRRRTAEIAFGE